MKNRVTLSLAVLLSLFITGCTNKPVSPATDAAFFNTPPGAPANAPAYIYSG